MKKRGKIKVKAVYFDVGHTLLRAQPSLYKYAAEVARRVSPEVTEQDFARVSHLMEKRFQLYLEDQAYHWSSRENILKLWEDVYGYWMELVGFKKKESRYLARALYERLGKADCWGVYPDVWETLEHLSRNGYYLGIISNWDERLELIIKQTGLDNYFSFVLSSAQAGFGKPDSRLFELAAEKLRVEKQLTLFIGDDPKADYYGALEAGMKACLIDRENKYPDFKGLKIKNLSELKEVVPSVPSGSDLPAQSERLK